jgi:hypothetical protein
MCITQNRRTRELFLNQEQYLIKVIERLRLYLNLSLTIKPRLILMAKNYNKLKSAYLDKIRTDYIEY